MKFLTVKQIIQIHADTIDVFGGPKGIRSKSLLESAVFRMRASFDGKDLYANVFDKAAALLESLLRNHPFLDGNKRTAFVSSVTFLEINGYETNFDAKGTEKFILAILDGQKSFKQIANFIKRNAEKSDSGGPDWALSEIGLKES